MLKYAARIRRGEGDDDGVAQLPPPALLLAGGARGKRGGGQRRLRLSQPTVSGQIRELEERFGEKLFQRSGPGLALTEVGRASTLRRRDLLARPRARGHGARPADGPADAAGWASPTCCRSSWRTACSCPRCGCGAGAAGLPRGQSARASLAELAVARARPGARRRAAARRRGARFNHLLGECGTSLSWRARAGGALQRGFPRSLDGAPLLLPAAGTALRRALDLWFDAASHAPAHRRRVRRQRADAGLRQARLGLFAAPAIEAESLAPVGVQRRGASTPVRQRFYAISVERRLKHPAVVAISEAAKEKLFG